MILTETQILVREAVRAVAVSRPAQLLLVRGEGRRLPCGGRSDQGRAARNSPHLAYFRRRSSLGPARAMRTSVDMTPGDWNAPVAALGAAPDSGPSAGGVKAEVRPRSDIGLIPALCELGAERGWDLDALEARIAC
jgi:hypothetical protein